MELEQFAQSFFKYVPRLSVVDWAETNLHLSARITETPGPYTTRLHPYVREILLAFNDPKVRRVSLCWGSQTAKTTTFYIGLAYVIAQQPKPILWIMPNEKNARQFSSERWMPFCEECEEIRKNLPRTANGIDRDRFTLLRQEFARCTMHLVGGGSPANVRSLPIGVLILDEIDVINETIRRESMDRIKGRHDYKIFQSSTPVSEQGGIWQEFQEGDRRRFQVPCPHCQAKITFDWKDADGNYCIKFDDAAKLEERKWDFGKVMATAWYKCQECGGKITDAHKSKMLRLGEWEATNPRAEPGNRSYHLNSLYSPTLTFGRIMVEWLRSQETLGSLQNFINGWLAEPWKDMAIDADPKLIENLQGEYGRGEKVGTHRIMGVDVQRAHLVYVVLGFSPDGLMQVIDHGNVPAWADVDHVVETYEVAAVIVDSGFGERTQETYEAIFQRRRTWWAAKGWDKLQQPQRINQIDPFTGTNKAGRYKIRLLNIDVTVWQGELAQRRAGKIEGFEVYKDVDPEFVRQFFAKYQVEETDKRGRKKVIWKVRRHRDDHFWDCCTYALCLSKIMGFGQVSDRVAPEPKQPKEPTGKVPPKSFWT